MRPNGHIESIFPGSMQRFLRLFVMQITVFFAVSCANPSPPLNIMVGKQYVGFAIVEWTAPNDSNKDSYRYRVKWNLNELSGSSGTVSSTRVSITNLVPGRNYTLTVTSSYNNKDSLPATITFITVPCGGMIRAQGWLSSPGYPENMNSNMDCVWDVKAPLGHVVLLTVMDLNYYHHDYPSLSRCNSGWLAVGYTHTSQRDILMCRYSDVGRTVVSPSNTLRVFYQISFHSWTKRFKVTLSSQDGCIPVQLKVVSYNLTSVTLSWIVPNDHSNTYLSFVSLFSSGEEIENHTTMFKEQTITGLKPFTDYNVSISSLCDGTESIPARIDVQTGPSAPLNIKVVEQDVLFASVRWTAPNDPNKDNYTYHVTWYQFEYLTNSRTVYNTEINITHLTPGRIYTLTVTSSDNNKYSLPATITFTTESCGGNLLAEGWLISPGFPFSYDNNMDCVWDVRAPDRHVVVLTVVSLDLEDDDNCQYDWLGVSYKNTTQPAITMCQAQSVGRIITSSSNLMRIFFHSDWSSTGRGFNITLSAQDGCIPVQLKVVSYNITSVTLSWIIPNDVNNTNISFVSLFSSGKEIQNHTTMYKEQTITGLSPFTEYNVSISSLCNGTEKIPAWIVVQTGPSPPMNLVVVQRYVRFTLARWTAPNDPNKNSYRYHVTVYLNEYPINNKTVDGTKLSIAHLAPGRTYTLTVTSLYNNKASLPATITFTTVPCGGKLRAEGRFSSPDYRQNIDLNMDCVWDIEAPLGHVVLLTVVDLNYYYYYPSSECYEHCLAVGYKQTSQKDITMCHYSDVGRTIISTSNMLRVFYRKSFYYDAVRFNITLSSQEDPSLSSTASAGTQAGTDTTAIESTSSVSTVESSTHPTSTTAETTIAAPDTTTQPGSSATTLLIPTTSRATGETTISTPDTTSQTMSSSATHLVSPTSATSRKTSSVSTSTAAETTISAPDTTTQPASSATTLLIPTTSTATGNCNEEKCQKKCTGIDSCQNGGTCSCDATCTITCNCGSSYKGSRCEMGVITFPAVRRQDAPKVMFDMTVQFGSTDLTTSEQETMLREQFRKLSGFNDVSVSPSNSEGTTSDYPVKTKFHYNNDNINKIYNGRLKNEIAKTFGAQVRASQGKITLKGNISQQNVPREDLDQVFQCNTSYEGYIVSLEDTGVFCISPCNDTSYCNNHGTCSHLVSGPKCSCDPVCNDQQKCTGCKTPESNLFKILFGTLGGLLGVGILLGIVFYCVKHPYPSKSIQPPNADWYAMLD